MVQRRKLNKLETILKSEISVIMVNIVIDNE